MALAQWGCGDRPEVTATAPAKSPASAAPATSELPEPGAIVVRQAPGSGLATLRIDEAWLARHGQAVLAQVRVACRYDLVRAQWQRLPASPTRIAYRMDPLPAKDATPEGRLFYELPREPALYWIHWIEQHEGTTAFATRRQMVTAAPAQCGTALLATTAAAKIGRAHV